MYFISPFFSIFGCMYFQKKKLCTVQVHCVPNVYYILHITLLLKIFLVYFYERIFKYTINKIHTNIEI